MKFSQETLDSVSEKEAKMLESVMVRADAIRETLSATTVDDEIELKALSIVVGEKAAHDIHSRGGNVFSVVALTGLVSESI